jgi:hypothetical protein
MSKVYQHRPAPASAGEHALLDLHRLDSEYSKAKRRLLFLFQRATAASLTVQYPSSSEPSRVDLEPADLRVVLDALRFDEAGVE